MSATDDSDTLAGEEHELARTSSHVPCSSAGEASAPEAGDSAGEAHGAASHSGAIGSISAGAKSHNPWTKEEDEKLRELVNRMGAKSWGSLAQHLPGRTGKSCRLRWINQLRGDLKTEPYSAEEDEIIIKMHATYGNKWTTICKSLPGRTDNSVKNRWNSTLRRRVEAQQQAVQQQQILAAHFALASASGSDAVPTSAAAMAARLQVSGCPSGADLQRLLATVAAGAAQPALASAADGTALVQLSAQTSASMQVRPLSPTPRYNIFMTALEQQQQQPQQPQQPPQPPAVAAATAISGAKACATVLPLTPPDGADRQLMAAAALLHSNPMLKAALFEGEGGGLMAALQNADPTEAQAQIRKLLLHTLALQQVQQAQHQLQQPQVQQELQQKQPSLLQPHLQQLQAPSELPPLPTPASAKPEATLLQQTGVQEPRLISAGTAHAASQGSPPSAFGPGTQPTGTFAGSNSSSSSALPRSTSPLHHTGGMVASPEATAEHPSRQMQTDVGAVWSHLAPRFAYPQEQQQQQQQLAYMGKGSTSQLLMDTQVLGQLQPSQQEGYMPAGSESDKLVDTALILPPVAPADVAAAAHAFHMSLSPAQLQMLQMMQHHHQQALPPALAVGPLPSTPATAEFSGTGLSTTSAGATTLGPADVIMQPVSPVQQQQQQQQQAPLQTQVQQARHMQMQPLQMMQQLQEQQKQLQQQQQQQQQQHWPQLSLQRSLLSLGCHSPALLKDDQPAQTSFSTARGLSWQPAPAPEPSWQLPSFLNSLSPHQQEQFEVLSNQQLPHNPNDPSPKRHKPEHHTKVEDISPHGTLPQQQQPPALLPPPTQFLQQQQQQWRRRQQQQQQQQQQQPGSAMRCDYLLELPTPSPEQQVPGLQPGGLQDVHQVPNEHHLAPSLEPPHAGGSTGVGMAPLGDPGGTSSSADAGVVQVVGDRMVPTPGTSGTDFSWMPSPGMYGVDTWLQAAAAQQQHPQQGQDLPEQAGTDGGGGGGSHTREGSLQEAEAFLSSSPSFLGNSYFGSQNDLAALASALLSSGQFLSQHYGNGGGHNGAQSSGGNVGDGQGGGSSAAAVAIASGDAVALNAVIESTLRSLSRAHSMGSRLSLADAHNMGSRLSLTDLCEDVAGSSGAGGGGTDYSMLQRLPSVSSASVHNLGSMLMGRVQSDSDFLPSLPRISSASTNLLFEMDLEAATGDPHLPIARLLGSPTRGGGSSAAPSRMMLSQARLGSSGYLFAPMAGASRSSAGHAQVAPAAPAAVDTPAALPNSQAHTQWATPPPLPPPPADR